MPGIAWMSAVEEDRLFLSVATLAEIRYGIERMPVSSRRDPYEGWLEHELPPRFGGGILPADAAVADTLGRVLARYASRGKPISMIDGFLAATAEVHSLALVTRNVQHFTALKAVLNPWV